nr:MAG TPA: hypothetical protein [Caudoviricetes sp.]
MTYCLLSDNQNIPDSKQETGESRHTSNKQIASHHHDANKER